MSTFTICSSAFESLARLVARSRKFDNARLGFVEHPLGGISGTNCNAGSTRCGRRSSHGSRSSSVTTPASMRAERLEVAADLDAFQELAESRRWTDGLPVVPPTVTRVEAMLESAGDAATASLGAVPPGGGDATLERLAACAVMAGCRPAYFPVVIAATRAMLRPEFNLLGVQATTHPTAALVVVSGPVARELAIHGGSGAFGPGFRANATIGRAIRLILINVGHGIPGEGDRSTQGSPAKFTYCVTENVEQTPWPEFHVSRGYSAGDNVVTVIGTEAPHNVNDHENTQAEALLEVVADTLRPLGNNNWYMTHHDRSEVVVALGPEHARQIASHGWSREDVQRFLFARVTRTIGELKTGGMWQMKDWAPDLLALSDDDAAAVPIVRRPEDVFVLVAGGPGKHSLVMPSFGITEACSELIAWPPPGAPTA